MYDELYEIIGDGIRYGEFDQEGRSEHGIMNGNLGQLLCWAITDMRDRLQDAITKQSILKVKVSLKDATNVQMVGKKMLVYSDQSIFEVEEDPSRGGLSPHIVPDTDYMTDEERDSWENHTRQLAEQARTSDPYESVVPFHFVEALVKLRPLIQTQKVIIIPKHNFAIGGTAEPGLFELRYNGYIAEFEQQLRERVNAQRLSTSQPSMDIKLPHLRHIPLEELAAFREHNALRFEAFHRHIRTLMEELSKAGARNDEKGLLHIIQEVDYEIRRMDEFYKDARRKSLVLSAYDLVYLAGGLTLYGVLPDHLYQLLVAAMGGAKLKSIIDRLIEDKSDKTSPFYIAWKLHHKYGVNPEDE